MKEQYLIDQIPVQFRLQQAQVANPQGQLAIVSDCHLGMKQAPVDGFISMLEALKNTQMLVILGDLFKIWLAHPKFWNRDQQRVMRALEQLRQTGCQVVFVIGNREVIFPRQYTDYWKKRYPFDLLVYDALELQWGGIRLGFTHGDLLNPHDANYLKFRAVARGRGFELFFKLFPPAVSQKIAEALENRLASTNQEYKVHFPEAQVWQFAEQVSDKYHHYFCGHFHLDWQRQFENGSLFQVVPDWLEQKVVLSLDAQGGLERHTYI